MADINFDNQEQPMTEQEEQAIEQEQPTVSTEPAMDAKNLDSHISHSNLGEANEDDEDDEDEGAGIDLQQMFEDIPRWLLSQWKVILLIIFCIFIYITTGYQAQEEMKEETALSTELKDWRIRSITRQSELTLLCRQSLLEKMLREQGDTTLLPNMTPPYKIIKEQ